MPDLFAHFSIGYLISRKKTLRQHTTFLVLGSALPDVLTRIPEIILDRFLGFKFSHFVIIFHTPLCLLLACFVVSVMFELSTRAPAFLFLFLGSMLHVLLDLMQRQSGDGVYIPYFPFSFEAIQWSLFHFNSSIMLFPFLLVAVIVAWLLTR